MVESDPTPRQDSSITLADGVSLIRIPLAVLLLLVERPMVRLLIVLLAGLSDLGDGWLARRRGGSRMGQLLDPITDKLFMATAFSLVLWQRWLPWYAVVAALLRDLVATIAFLISPRRTVAARPGGKLVTGLQFLTLTGALLLQPWREPVAWLTGIAALYALRDYWQLSHGKHRIR